MTRNRHPVDRLADVRAEIKKLQEEETALRDALLAEDADLSGVEFYARVVTSETNRLDRKKAEAKFGAGALADCFTASTTTSVRIVSRYGDAA